ncbi:PREDICTED: uncharacterized protein LOC101368212 [Odobenus rosmarus divergens]|uniref:Uncharacterized protein LOC101368212 n=1 Tax=Odobenus rosmarus divergens TaxID=9708 RepID=A0A9B0GCF6_ODORO
MRTKDSLLKRSSESRSQTRRSRLSARAGPRSLSSLPASAGPSQLPFPPPRPPRPPALAAAGHLHRNPGPGASAPGRAECYHNNRAPAAEAAGEERQRAGEELAEARGKRAGRGDGRAKPGGRGARVRVGQGDGLSAGSGARRRLRRGWMATGAPGSRVGLVVSGPHGPLTQPGGPLRATLRSRPPCASRSLRSEVGV